MRKLGVGGVVFSVLVGISSLALPVSVDAVSRGPNGPATTPLSGTTVLVSAEATDDVGVAGVQFLVDGLPLGDEDLTPPYSTVWDTTRVGNGLHMLSARARDLSGNESTSEAVEVLVDNAPPPDTSLPSAVITSPENAAVVSATIAISAAASDNVGVVGAQFFVDGVPVGLEDTAAPWTVSIDTAGVSNGQHSVTVRVRDAAGNLATSSAVWIVVDNQVPDTSGPGVEISAPHGGATLQGPVTVTAVAMDDGGVAGVQFLLDGAPLGSEVIAAPYSVVWETTGSEDGNHTLQVKARDSAGNQTTSQSVTVVVENTTSSEDPNDPVATPDLRVGITLERFGSADEIVIRAQSDAPSVALLELLIDDQSTFAEDGSTLAYSWDTRPLVGLHQIQVIGYDAMMQMVTSSSAYQIEVDAASRAGVGHGRPESPTTLETALVLVVSGGGSPGLMRIEGGSGLAGVRWTRLYIDGELVGSERNGKPVDYLWATGDGSGPHEIVLAAEDRSGVLAVASLVSP